MFCGAASVQTGDPPHGPPGAADRVHEEEIPGKKTIRFCVDLI